VKDYLVQHGVAADRVKTRGAGPDEPIDTNTTPAGRANNRRIEFRLLD
jgi:outer membrane protein OmpA-like peptidoglycan-associated protein